MPDSINPPRSGSRRMLITLGIAALTTIAIVSLLVNIFERKQEAETRSSVWSN